MSSSPRAFDAIGYSSVENVPQLDRSGLGIIAWIRSCLGVYAPFRPSLVGSARTLIFPRVELRSFIYTQQTSGA